MTSPLEVPVEPGDPREIQAYTDRSADESTLHQSNLELDDDALTHKTWLDHKLQQLSDRLASDEVRDRGHYQPGGAAELIDEMRRLQLEELPKIYANTQYQSGYLVQHDQQETESWCQLACLSNASRALGQEPPAQREIAEALAVHPQERPFTAEVLDFARGRGFETQGVETIAQMIDTLTSGSKVVLNIGYPAFPMQHAVLVSGIRVDRGQFEFFCNDPAWQHGVQTLGLNRMLELLEPAQPHNALYRSYAISLAK